MNLKSFIVLVLMILSNITLLGQKTIEVFGGGSYNYLFDGGGGTGHYMS